jgi:hypothetical protein
MTVIRCFTQKSVALVATITLVIGALIVPAIATAKPVSFTITTGKLTLGAGGKFTGKASGTFGKGTVTGKAVPPNVTMTLRVKGGTITAASKDANTVGGKVQGAFKLKGTGKYKKIKGSGKFTGNPATFVFSWKGKASY